MQTKSHNVINTNTSSGPSREQRREQHILPGRSRSFTEEMNLELNAELNGRFPEKGKRGISSRETHLCTGLEPSQGLQDGLPCYPSASLNTSPLRAFVPLVPGVPLPGTFLTLPSFLYIIAQQVLPKPPNLNGNLLTPPLFNYPNTNLEYSVLFPLI